jgi:ribosomal protein S7
VVAVPIVCTTNWSWAMSTALSAPEGRLPAVSLAAIASVEPLIAAEVASVAAVAPVKNAMPVEPSRPTPAAWRALTEPATDAASVSIWAR